MSAWSRLAVLAAGAAVGIAAGRLAGSDGGRRAAGELVARARPAPAGERAVEPTDDRLARHRLAERGAPRENRLASRALRLAQDIRVGMGQRESELRAQLRLPAPQAARDALTGADGGPRRPQIADGGDAHDLTKSGEAGFAEGAVIDHCWSPPPRASGAD